MQDIELLRSEIDRIHRDMGLLFQQRLSVIQKIWKLKKVNQIALVDVNREQDIIHCFDAIAKDENEKLALQNFFKIILEESKSYAGKQLK